MPFRHNRVRNCLIILLLMTMATSSCSLLVRDLEQPEVRLVSIAPQQIGFSGIRMLCVLQIDNPNDIDIPVKGGQFELEVEGISIASGELPGRLTVPALSKEFVEVIVDVNTGNSLALLLNVLGGATTELEYALTGYIDVAMSLLGRVQIDERGSVPLGNPRGNPQRNRQPTGTQQTI